MERDDDFLEKLFRGEPIQSRRVYADWLEQHGRLDAAELLRLQCDAFEREARLTQLARSLPAHWLTQVGDPKQRRRFTLAAGRVITLEHLEQFEFYAGVLEGLPTREMNAAQLERLLANHAVDGVRPHLIAPVERLIPLDRRHPGTPAEFPEVVCIARFQSAQPARDTELDASELKVVWFQQQYAFPIAPGVMSALLALDWSALATDFTY